MIRNKTSLGNASDSGSLKELLTKSDVITLHVPELESTRNLINKSNIRYIKRAVLINYARGEVVDLHALRKTIQSGQVGGAAIDVFPVEPEKR